jgi:hypothetical protein
MKYHENEEGDKECTAEFEYHAWESKITFYG